MDSDTARDARVQTDRPARVQPRQTIDWRGHVSLFRASFAILLLELMLIRFVPAYIRTLAFFTNFVLLASLLGGGIGALTHRRIRIAPPPLAMTLAVLVLLVWTARFTLMVPSVGMLFYGATGRGTESLWTVPAVFVLVTLCFIPLGQEVGRRFACLPPLSAYAADIAGSLAGIASFVTLAWAGLPPLVWFAVFALVAMPFWLRHGRATALRDVLCMALVLATAWYAGLSPGATHTLWSPYYRILYGPNQSGDGFVVTVNNIGHQETRPLDRKEPFYFQAYRQLGTPPFRRVLVIGAGTGTDVAVALAHGAERVDAVEIDPLLYQLGGVLNPAHPYDDPRVHVRIDDGRAVLRHDDTKYDLIVFALTDSLALTSSQTNVRLESFLFTTQSMAEARAHLAPDGLLVAYNYYRRSWSIRKLAGMIEDAFGTPPYVVSYGAVGRAAVFMDGPRLASLSPGDDHPYVEANAAPAEGEPQGADLPQIGAGRLSGDPSVAPATDDWPFFYLEKAGLPVLYQLAIATVLILSAGLLLLFAPGSALRRFDWHFLALGAAFMLLETRSLVTFALLFGTTWLVNALVFFAILTSVLLAIGISAVWHVRRGWPLYALLFVAIGLNFVVPQAAVLSIGSASLRYGVASALTFAPVFLANLVFARSFRATAAADAAFASNLIGIMIGGLAEYAALRFGYTLLLLPVAALYAAAMMLKRRKQALLF